MRLEAMRWYVLCTVVSTIAGAAAAFCVKVLPRDANWRVTCGNDGGSGGIAVSDALGGVQTPRRVGETERGTRRACRGTRELTSRAGHTPA